MSKPQLSKRKVDALSNGVFLIGLGVLFFTDAWWPGILIAIWASLGLRQWLTGREFDFIITSVILWGLFVVSFFNITWSVLVPVLFFLGGIYIIWREFFYSEDKSEELQDDADLEK